MEVRKVNVGAEVIFQPATVQKNSTVMFIALAQIAKDGPQTEVQNCDTGIKLTF